MTIEQNETICTLKLSGLLIDLKSELLARSLLKNTVLERRVITNHAVTSAVRAWIKQFKGEEYTDVSKQTILLACHVVSSSYSSPALTILQLEYS